VKDQVLVNAWGKKSYGRMMESINTKRIPAKDTKTKAMVDHLSTNNSVYANDETTRN